MRRHGGLYAKVACAIVLSAAVLLTLPMIIAPADVGSAIATTRRWSYWGSAVRIVVMIIAIITVSRILGKYRPGVSIARIPYARVRWRLLVWYLGLEAVFGLRALESLVSIASPRS